MTSFDAQPTLSDGTVLLRPLLKEDRHALYAVAHDPEIWASHPAHDRWQQPVFDAFFDAGVASGGALVIEDAATGEVIGSSRYGQDRAECGEVEIGWTFLARARWGGRTNHAVKRLMIVHALGAFERVIFVVGENNIRSRRAMERIGARLTGRLVDAVAAGQPVRHVVYAIDRSGFGEGPLVTD